MNYRNISDLNTAILKNMHFIPRDIDLVVGVPRSGMLPANLLALYLNLPYTDIHSFINGYIYKAGARKQFFDTTVHQNILIVDDSLASGSALAKCKQSLQHLSSEFDFRYLVVFTVPEKKHLADISLEVVPTPRYFQWNIFNHSTLDKACFDIDGVLCVDPTDTQNDDGPNYQSFILNATPLHIPRSKIGCLVTSRLEKYRKETEYWLHNHNIRYDNLVMLDLPDMKTRRKANCHGVHKAKHYKQSKYMLFVESDLSQALQINKLTKKPVFCTQTFEMIYETESILYNLKSGKHLPFLREAALKLRGVIHHLTDKEMALK